MPPVASAAASAAPAATIPSHRCHSLSGDTSISGARAKRQPAMVANDAKTAPARTFPTATVRQFSSAVTIAAPLGQCGRDDERNRKVNQQRVEATDQCHLQVETAPARGLFPGKKRIGCVSMR